MANPVATSFSGQTASLRNLKRLVVLLVCSNIALGVFSVYLLRSVDQRYTELLGHSVPVLNDLQTLTAQSVAAMRGTGTTLSNAPAEARADLVQRAREAIRRDRDLRNRLLKGDWLASKPDGKTDFQTSGEAFTQASTDVLNLFAAGKIAEATALRDRAVRPVFDQYLDSTTKVADLLQTESQRTNADYTAKTGSLSTIVLGLAGWPLLVFGALLLLVMILVIAMMVAFRGKDLADAP